MHDDSSDALVDSMLSLCLILFKLLELNDDEINELFCLLFLALFFSSWIFCSSLSFFSPVASPLPIRTYKVYMYFCIYVLCTQKAEKGGIQAKKQIFVFNYMYRDSYTNFILKNIIMKNWHKFKEKRLSLFPLIYIFFNHTNILRTSSDFNENQPKEGRKVCYFFNFVSWYQIHE